MDLIGQQLGSHKLVEHIGSGGYADVYRGEHHRLHTQVAIKVLKSPEASPQQEEEFRREARIITDLRHPHIIRVIDYGIWEEPEGLQRRIPYIVMIYAPLGNMRMAYPQGQRVPLEKVGLYIKQMASALQYAHSQSNTVVHCDIKPENMLRMSQDHLILTDFGIAKDHHSTVEVPNLKKDQQGSIKVFGTPAYLPPERCLGESVSRAGDQYALAVVAYEWLAGHRPFEGVSSLEIMTKKVQTDPPSLLGEFPDIPREVNAVVLKALSRQAADRYPTIEGFAQALEQAIAGQQANVPAAQKKSAAKNAALPGVDQQAINLGEATEPEETARNASPSPANQAPVGAESAAPSPANQASAHAGNIAPSPANQAPVAAGSAAPSLANQVPASPESAAPSPANQAPIGAGSAPPISRRPALGANAPSSPRRNPSVSAGAGTGGPTVRQGGQARQPTRQQAGGNAQAPQDPIILRGGTSGDSSSYNETTGGHQPITPPRQQNRRTRSGSGAGLFGWLDRIDILKTDPPHKFNRGHIPRTPFRFLNRAAVILLTLALAFVALPSGLISLPVGIIVVGIVALWVLNRALYMVHADAERVFLSLISAYYFVGLVIISLVLYPRFLYSTPVQLLLIVVPFVGAVISLFSNHRYIKLMHK